MAYPQYPDLSESVLDTLKGNQNFFDDINSENERIKKSKIAEVAETFPLFNEDHITRVLEACRWEVPEAIYALIQEMEKQSRTKPDAEKERRERKDREREESKKFLWKMFESLPRDLVQQTLDELEGDVDMATNKLIKIVEEMEKERRKERERETIAKTIWDKFRDVLSKQEVDQVLIRYNWDVKESAGELLKLSEKRKVDRVAAVLQDVSRSIIEQTLRQKNWNAQETLAALLEEKHKKAAQEKEQVLKKQKEEELKRQDEERRRKEEDRVLEMKRKTMEEEAKSKEVQEKMAQELKAKFEAERKAREEAEAIARKVKEEEDRRKAEEQKLIAEKRAQKEREEEQKKADELRLAMSRLIVQNVLQEVDKRNEEEKEEMKEELGVLLRSGIGAQPAIPVEEKVENDQIRKSEPFPMSAGNAENVLQGVGVRLTALPSEVDCGSVITVTYTVDQPPPESKRFVHSPSTTDWIAMYYKGADYKNYETYKWVPGTEKSGSVQFTAPSKVGELMFKYFSQKSFNLCATSNTIALGPRFQLKTTTTATTDKRTCELSVKQTFGGDYSNAWIGLYEKKANKKSDKQYHSYQYLSAGLPSPSDPKEKTYKFDIPKAGQWEFRLFLHGLPWVEDTTSSAVQSTTFLIEGDDSLVFTVQHELNQVTVEFSISVADPKTDSVWIGIYHANQIDNRQFRRYKYISDQKGKVTFKKLQHSGVYEARLFANYDQQVPLCKSNPLEIQMS